MPGNTEFSIPETIATGQTPDPLTMPQMESTASFFPRMNEHTFAELKRIMGGVTKGRDTRGQEENQALIDNNKL